MWGIQSISKILLQFAWRVNHNGGEPGHGIILEKGLPAGMPDDIVKGGTEKKCNFCLNIRRYRFLFVPADG